MENKKLYNVKALYSLFGVLFVILLVQGYYIYDLKNNPSTTGVPQELSITQQKSSTTKQIDPFVQMQKMQEEMMRNFGNFNSFFANDPFFQDAFSGMKTAPMSDIKERDNQYIIEMNIPGALKEKINIKTDNNMINVSAISEKEVDNKDTNYIRKERVSQHFERAFSLPENADLDKMKSDYKDGVLTIKVPKK